VRRINYDLGEWLAAGGTSARTAMAQSVAAADSVLLADTRRSTGPVDAVELDELRAKGCFEPGQVLGSEQAAEVVAHLAPKSLLIGHDPGRSRAQAASLAGVPQDKNYACYGYLDLWSSPHLLEFAAQDKFLDLAQDYLGCTPTLSVLNAYWSLPERVPEPDLQAFHRDADDCRSLTIFTLLTPVDVPEEGAHSYVEASHDPTLLEQILRADGVGTKIDYLLAGPFVAPMAMRLFNRGARSFHGPAGFALCVDPYGLHRSVVPRSKPKLLLEIRFGTFFNESASDLRLVRDAGLPRLWRRASAMLDQRRRQEIRKILQRIPATSRHQYVFRHLIRALADEL
jgi:hypothetical protein